ncbi:peptidoglycan recognition protein family protein [Phyllobacterium endophyticum]|uniref:N-acetylmuramoyl-L-alanine amidase n=1 Tax=Phyllobacterium endophyticum TaxID=1149773 RepID=A0A2P7ANJ7_9HYPH|nr:N-acetylmuramoyl-L-alanine amidase [Phyllobacterium endophyticum]MBB3233906.1 N-acetylmuramoyl-L-alanine amidase [Phyllobacterium endophyticum]PSH55784.1 N-acetylmuramoyl-L-alanine amidase [Phyllobacterium endophyticum]TYR43694.1 N-acetylmuramoyl-L-alanine amidase [Phyllobacterium endophyticum]
MSAFKPDHPGADVHASPNFGPRREGKRPSIVVLHYTGMETGTAAESWLANPLSEVSAHYVVHEGGRIVQMVPENERAWHAGQSSWKGEADINSSSIGIEIVNGGPLLDFPQFPDQQIDAVIDLCKGIISRHAIRPENVLAHSDIAPGRKIDPGERFPWSTLYDAGVGHWVAPSPVRGGRFFSLGDEGQPVEALQSLLALYGYDVPIDGVFGASTQLGVLAFQRHFRVQKVDGVADVSTVETLHRLLSELPGFAR